MKTNLYQVRVVALMLLFSSIVWVNDVSSCPTAEIIIFPYFQDFEAFTNCGTGCGASCTLSEFWSNPGGDNLDWLVDIGGTSSANTGPSVDHTSGSNLGKYLYVETSCSGTGYPNKTAYLVSPQFDFSGLNAPQLMFWYHMYGNSMGTMHLDVSTDGGANWTLDYIPSWTDNLDIWKKQVVDLSAFAGACFNFRIRGISGSSFGSDMAVDDFTVFDLVAEDIAICEILNPQVPTCALGTQNVLISIQNAGTDPLDSCEIQWTINGATQSITNYTSTLDPGEKDTIAIGSSSFNESDQLQIWVKNPNGMLENPSSRTNDTLALTLISGLSGIYTVGGTTPDYNTLQEAIDDLNVFGICGPVVFNIRDGIYNEQLVLGLVKGVSNLNTITFTSESMDSSAVIISFASSLSTSNYTVLFDGAHHFVFDQLTIEATGPTYARVIQYIGSSSNNIIRHSNIKGINSSTTSTNVVVIYSAPGDGLDSLNTFENNLIEGGSYGMYWYGNSPTSLESGTKILNNFFKDQYYYGIRLYYQDAPEVVGNRMQSNTNYTGTSFAYYLYYCDNGTIFNNNQLLFGTGIFPRYGLYMVNCDGNVNDNGLISNNFLTVDGTGNSSTFYGIYISNSSFLNIVHNNVLVLGGGVNSRSFYITSGGQNELFNNNLVNKGPGYAIYAASPFSLNSADYNNYFTTGIHLGYFNNANQSDLDSWTSASGYDANGFSVDPNYFGNNDLHICNLLLDESGTNTGLVLDDFDGESRGGTVDIGADEFIPDPTPLVAAYSEMVTSLMVDFTDLTSGNVNTWYWDFGDGDTSTTQNPSKTYVTDGIYTVCLVVGDGCKQDTLCKSISVGCPIPIVDFSFTSNTFTASFTDLTSGAVTSSLWDFGDGNTSTLTNPMHTYAALGVYKVCLTNTNLCGTDSSCQMVAITCDSLVVNAGPLQIICNPGDSVTLGGMPTASGGTAPYTYSWLPTTGISQPTIANPRALPPNDTTYTIMVTDVNGCMNEDSVRIIYPTGAITALNISEDFETMNLCSGSCNDPCPLLNGWVNDAGDNANWIVDENGTSSSSTGPSIDHTTMTSTGNYIYLESSSPCYPNKTANLLSPILDLSGTNAPILSFWYHMFGNAMGNLHFDISLNGGVSFTNDFIPSITDNQDLWQYKEISLAPFQGQSMVQIRFRGVTGSSFTSDMALDDIRIFDLLPLNAAVIAIDTPSTPFCASQSGLVITLENQGTNELNKAILNWSLNGVLQPSYNWSGVLTSLQNELVNMAPLATFSPGDSVAVWVTDPNSSCEPVAGAVNDTITKNLTSGLAGTYYIGGPMTDYASFTAAVQDLVTLGVCGPTLFLVHDSTFIEQIEIPEILGASAINTITFRSASGDSTASILRYNSVTSVNNYTIRFADNAAYITFDQLGIISDGVTYGHVLEFICSHDITFSNCEIKGIPSVSTTSTNMTLIYSPPGSIDDHVTFVKNRILYGSYGFYWYGTGIMIPEIGTQILDNVIDSQYYYGLRLYYQEDFKVERNQVICNTAYTGTNWGIYVFYGGGVFTINDNQVLPGNQGFNYGIYIGNTVGMTLDQCQIVNNFVSTGNPGKTSTVYGFYSTNSGRYLFDHNNMLVNGGSNSSRAYYATAGGALTVRNNNFVNWASSYAFYGVQAFLFSNLDYNNYYNNGGNLIFVDGVNYLTFEDWVMATAFDANSLSTDPLYISSTDLHVQNCLLIGAGTYNGVLPLDIDNQTRSNPPTIGADEITAALPMVICNDTTIYLDASGTAVLTPDMVGNNSIIPCGIDTSYVNKALFACSDVGVNSVTLVVKDFAGVIDSCVAMVTVVDTIKPALSCQDYTAALSLDGMVILDTSLLNISYYENCRIDTFFFTQDTFTCSEIGMHTVGLTMIDQSGNDTSCTFTLTVVDTIPPSALCQDIDIYLDPGGLIIISPADVDANSSSSCGFTMSISKDTFLCNDVGPNVVVLTVISNNGKMDTCHSTVTVRDTFPPVFTFCPADIITFPDMPNGCGALINYSPPIATDACTGVTIMQTDTSGLTSGQIFPAGVTVQEYTATDANGNMAICRFNVVVRDTLPPSITCPGDTTIQLGPFACEINVIYPSPIGMDNCMFTITQINGLPTGSLFPIGVTKNTFIVEDPSTNTDTCSFTVTVLENGQPNPLTQHILRSSAGLVCQDKVHVSLGADCQRLITARDLLPFQSAGCIDRYRVSLNIQRGTSSDPIPNNTVNETHRGHEITFMVEDMETGNRCWGTLLVEEKYPPQIICRNDTISCLHMGERADLVITSDNCSDIKPQIDVMEKVWTDLGCEDREFIGYLSRKVRATDLWGNYNECRDTLWVWKEVLDSLICPEDTALACNLQHGNVDVLWKTGANGYTYLDAEGYAHPWPTDARGIAPAPYLKSIDPDQADGYMIPMKTDSGPVFDNGGKCHIVFKYKDHVIPTCGKAYKIRREWIISDWCAKRDTTCIQWIKITDELPPVIDTRYFVPDNDPDLGPWLIEDHDLKATVDAHDCKAHVALEDIRNLVERRTGIAHPDGGWAKECDDDLKLYYELEYADPTHPGKKVVIQENYDDKQYLYLPAGYYVITWRLQDQCWNESRVRQKVWVFDETPPVPVCDEITQVTLDPEACWARIDAIDLDDGSHDNCCDRLHFAVAQMDSINHWRKYWTDYFIGCLAPYDYQHYHSEIEQAIEEWINIFVFDDYVDLTECGEENLVLRVYEACDMPPYDPHVFYGGKHEWYWWNLSDKFAGWYYWRLNEYLHYGDPRASFSCDLITAALPVAANGDGGFSPVQWDYPVDPLHCPTPITEAHGGKKSPICKYLFESSSAENEWKQRVQLPYPSEVSILEGLSEKKRYEFPHLYSDCMIEVIKDDKTPPVCKAPADVTYYCDGVPYHWIIPVGVDQVQGWGASYAHDVCYESDVIRANCELDKTPVQVWDVRNGGTDKLSKLNGTIANPARWCVAVPWNGGEHGYYGGPTDGYYTEDCDSKPWGVTGMVYDYDWKPIYCRVWLLLDQYDLGDASGKPDPKSYFGEVEYSDNCWVDEPTYEDSGSLNECGVGVLTRTWTVKDKCENQSVCYQRVVIKPRSDFEVVFPPDVEVNCNELEGLDPDIAGRPIVSDDDCELIGINYVDERFTITADGCYKILRTWTLIDWCVYDPDQHFRHPDVIVDDRVLAGEDRGCVYRHLKDDGDGYMIYLQVIKVVDEEAPEVTCTTPQVICNYDEDCEPEVLELDFGSATDNCALADEIAYRYIIKVGQSEDSGDWLYGHGNTHTGALPFGIHDVYLIATDRCGNEDTCTTQVAINDCKRPTPYCYDGVATVVMPSSQSVEVWAKDLDAGSFDNCTEKDNLYFSFDAFGLESSRVFTCADIPDGKMEQIEVEIYVWDEAGNVDKCVTYILLQDGSGDVCEDQIIAANPGAKEMGLSMSGQGKVQKNNAGQGSLDIRENNGHAELFQNRPNPFRNETEIGFYLPKSQQVVIRIYNVNGQTVARHEGNYATGNHTWRYRNTQGRAGTGLLYYQLQTDSRIITMKMVKVE